MKRIYKTPFVGDLDSVIALGDQPLEVVGVHEDGTLLVATDEDLPADSHHFERQPQLERANAKPANGQAAKSDKGGKPANGQAAKSDKGSEPANGQAAKSDKGSE